MKIEIEYIVSPTLKEIYWFEREGREDWRYVGIMYSRRNDENDIWGDQWEEYYDKQKDEELEELARKHGFDSLFDANWDRENCPPELRKIIDKYNPIANHTKNGEPYYCGEIFANWSKKPAPKLSIEEIKQKILEKISKIKVAL